MPRTNNTLQGVLNKHADVLVSRWVDLQRKSAKAGDNAAADLVEQSKRFVSALQSAVSSGNCDTIETSEWSGVRDVLDAVTRQRALDGYSPSETATFVFSLKEPIFDAVRKEAGNDNDRLAQDTLAASMILDQLGLYTTEVYQKSREQVIQRQQEEMLELSTPVVQLWDGILALPLIGTLDSARTQVVMENLLQEIVKTEAEVAIIDITGVPTVDTLVAQHLLKTVSAARLMGADCIISGIRPQIAQTLVHLGVELNVVSKATMADALALALKRIGKQVTERKMSKFEQGKRQAAED